jgi:hypothetical protein
VTAQTPTPGYLPPEHRGEWTDAAGKLYHRTADGSEHVGSWLTCDACNPIAVVYGASSDPETYAMVDLRAAYDEAEREYKAAEEKLKAVKDKLRTQLSEATNGALRSALHVPGYQPITLTYGEAWTVDSKKLKAEQPLVYVQYAKLGSRWTLAVSKQGRQ